MALKDNVGEFEPEPAPAPDTAGIPGDHRLAPDPQGRPSIIEVERLSFAYAGPRGRSMPVIDDLSLTILDQEFLCVVGSSGCGKSTLLNILAGLISPDSGEVRMNGQPITTPSPERAMVFQDDAVFPWYTVRQNIEYGPKIAHASRKTVRQTADRFLRLVGLQDFDDAYPRQLSGGMRKRVDVARAMALDPPVLLMDEPFAALDVMTKERLQLEFVNLWGKSRRTVIFVTHDLEEALFLADRIAVMSSRPGRIDRIVSVPFPRPRPLELKTEPEFQSLRRDLIAELKPSFIDNPVEE
jgi:NitT/TauT family transport system ATP-binding protein